MFSSINVQCLKLMKRSFWFSRRTIITKKDYFDINCVVLLYCWPDIKGNPFGMK